MRGATVQVICACGKEFTARVADRNRGWAQSCSKQCAALAKNKQAGEVTGSRLDVLISDIENALPHLVHSPVYCTKLLNDAIKKARS